jgi:hypothetical protein
MPHQLAPHITDSLLRSTRLRQNRLRAVVNVQQFGREVTMRYFQRLGDENFIREFCVFAVSKIGLDPKMQLIWEPIPGDIKSRRYWDKRIENSTDFGELAVFRPPDGYDGGPVIFWYNRFKHWVEGYVEEPKKICVDMGQKT